MIDAGRVTLLGIYLVRAHFDLNINFAQSEGAPALTLAPRWAFPSVRHDQQDGVGFQQYVVLEVHFRRGDSERDIPVDEAPLTLRVELLGDYVIQGLVTDEELEAFAAVAVAHIFPFAREAAHNLSARNWNPRIMLPLINLNAQLAEWRKQAAARK